MQRYVHLRPRLEAVAALMPNVRTAADIGCDHGRLGVGLLQKGIAEYVIAADVSVRALGRARALAQVTGLLAAMDFRAGDGLHVLEEGEAQAVALCGMGGMLIARILQAARAPLMGADIAVLQPMRGAAELRRHVYTHGMHILREAIVFERARMYQVFSVARGEDAPPHGWPENFYALGFRAVKEPLFPELAGAMLLACESKLVSARGSRAEARLRAEAERLRYIVRHFT